MSKPDHGTPPNDDRFDDYLRGDTSLSSEYRSVSDTLPPAHVDSVVLSAARQAAEQRTAPGWLQRPWFAPMATTLSAAVVAGVVLLMQPANDMTGEDGQAEFRQPATARIDRITPAEGQSPLMTTTSTGTSTGAAAIATPSTEHQHSDLDQQRRLERQAGVAGVDDRDAASTEQSMPQARGLDAAAARSTTNDDDSPFQNAEDWLEAIVEHRERGEHDAAERLIEQFVATYPDIDVPAEAMYRSE